MKSRPDALFLLLLAIIGLTPALLFAMPSASPEPAQTAARLLARGSLAAKSPPEARARPAAPSLEAALDLQARALEADPEAAERVAERAFIDAFGISPDAPSAPAGAPHDEALLYHTVLARQLDWLGDQPDVYEAVIHRAYRWVIQREAYAEELAYWEERPTLSYLLLVGSIEDWARRNQPGLMVTAGTPTISVNCPYLETLRLPPEIAATARSAINLPAAQESRHIVAPGAQAIESSGGVHFIAVGSPALRHAARSGD